MRKFLAKLVAVGAVVGAIVVAIRGKKLFEGSPEGVGEEQFHFEADDDDPYAVDESKLGGDVSQELLDRLVCPLDKGPLELVDGAWLVNPRNGYRYPIVDGIPVMLVDVGKRYRDPAESEKR
jgi:uncharacterized protein YbaR (Trm112 family)